MNPLPRAIEDAGELQQLRHLKGLLANAIRNGRSQRWCLRLWSRYIRTRDAQRCVCCGSGDRIQAHHIFRRALFPIGAFDLGNGISLCHSCHRDPHSVFNGRPDLSLPINAQGGDDQDEIACFYKALLVAAESRGLDHDEFYFIGDRMLQFFVRVQGYEYLYWTTVAGETSRLWMAAEIWSVMPEIFQTNFVQELVRLNLAK